MSKSKNKTSDSKINTSESKINKFQLEEYTIICFFCKYCLYNSNFDCKAFLRIYAFDVPQKFRAISIRI